jgi:hypothetical protein
MNEARFIVFMARMCHIRNKVTEKGMFEKGKLIRSGTTADIQVPSNLPRLAAPTHEPSQLFKDAADTIKLQREHQQPGKRAWRLPEAISANEARKKVDAAISKLEPRLQLMKLAAALLSSYLTSENKQVPSKDAIPFNEFKLSLVEMIMEGVESKGRD